LLYLVHHGLGVFSSGAGGEDVKWWKSMRVDLQGTQGVSHPDLRTNPNARIHVRQDQVTHMHRRSEYQNTV
jgi:hypothetical protein